MARHIHIHLPQRTHDAGWEEGKHPRDHGQFATKEGDAGGGGKPDAQRVKIAYSNASKYSTLAMAKEVQEKQKYPAQVLMGENGQYLVPANAKEGSLLRAGGYEVALDYNGKPPEKKGTAGSGAAQMPAKKPTKAETLKAAKAEYAAAGNGKGNYAKAAEMFEAAGDKDKAAGATALAKRYGHDKEGQEKKAALDIAESKKERAAAAKQPTPELRALSEKLADAYEQRSKDPENNKLTATINGLKDELAEAEHEARK